MISPKNFVGRQSVLRHGKYRHPTMSWTTGVLLALAVSLMAHNYSLQQQSTQLRIDLATSKKLEGLPKACASLRMPSGLNHDVISSEHCIFTMDDYLTENDILSMISLGNSMHRKRMGLQWPTAAFASEFLSDPDKTNAPQIVLDVERKIAMLTGISPHPGETPLMFMTQKPGALGAMFLRNIHHDHHGGRDKLESASRDRTVTVLVYLSDAEDDDGGHTIFPTIPSQHQDAIHGVASKMARIFSQGFTRGERSMSPYNEDGSGPSDNSKPGGDWNHDAYVTIENECKLALSKRNNVMVVKPKKGMALVFPSVLLNDKTIPNPLTWHATCHATKGPPRRALQKYKADLTRN